MAPDNVIAVSALMPASFDEAVMLQHARDALRVARGAFEDGDPFDDSVMHAAVRQMIKVIGDHDRTRS